MEFPYFEWDPTFESHEKVMVLSEFTDGDFTGSAMLEITWSRLCSKFLISSGEAHWQQHFERHPAVENLSIPQKSEPVLQRTLHQNRCNFTYF